MSGFTVNNITVFTVSGDNESVTCALNAVSALLIEGVTSPISQIELCEDKSLAKIYTSDNPALGLFNTDDVRVLLQGSEVCYRIDDALEVTNVVPLTSSDIRSRLWGNVEIRDLITCGNVNYLQVPADYIMFTIQILTASNPASLACYHPVPLNCACVPTVTVSPVTSTNLVQVGNSSNGNSGTIGPFYNLTLGNTQVAITGSVNTSPGLKVSQPDGSVYVMVQFESSVPIIFASFNGSVTDLNSSPGIYTQVAFNSDYDSTTGNFQTASWIFCQDPAVVSSSTVISFKYSFVPAQGVPSGGGYAFISLEAVELYGVSHPSTDFSTAGGSVLFNDENPLGQFTSSAANEFGLLSVAAQGTGFDLEIISEPDTDNVVLASLSGYINVILPYNLPPKLTGIGASLYNPGNNISANQTVQVEGESVDAFYTPPTSTSVNWVTAVVGVLPAVSLSPPTVIPCPPPNCHYPVPNCKFKFPCEQLCCKKKTKK